MVRRLVLAAAVVATAWLGIQWVSWPDVGALAGERPTSTAFIDRHLASRADGDGVRWKWVGYDRIARSLKRAVVVAEDIGFFDHSGFATAEIGAALRDAWERRRMPRGASTLTQQLAKNLWLSPSRNPLRKLKEAVLTRQLEDQLSKRRILELYLNVVELGPGIYGVEAGARHYYGRSAERLSPRQAAGLAAALPRPTTWHPGCGLEGYERYVDTIERRMARADWLDGHL